MARKRSAKRTHKSPEPRTFLDGPSDDSDGGLWAESRKRPKKTPNFRIIDGWSLERKNAAVEKVYEFILPLIDKPVEFIDLDHLQHLLLRMKNTGYRFQDRLLNVIAVPRTSPLRVQHLVAFAEHVTWRQVVEDNEFGHACRGHAEDIRYADQRGIDVARLVAAITHFSGAANQQTFWYGASADRQICSSCRNHPDGRIVNACCRVDYEEGDGRPSVICMTERLRYA